MARMWKKRTVYRSPPRRKGLVGTALEGGRFCVVCDSEPVPETRVSFRGTQEYLLMSLVVLGVPQSEASALLRDNQRRLIPEDNENARLQGIGAKGLGAKWWSMVVTCCAECASKSGLEVGTKADKEIPAYRTREGFEEGE